MAKEGRQAKAVELVTFVAHHAATKTMARERSEQLLAQLKDQLPVDAWQAAHERGRSQMLETIVAETN
jgi:hypothetical protein